MPLLTLVPPGAASLQRPEVGQTPECGRMALTGIVKLEWWDGMNPFVRGYTAWKREENLSDTDNDADPQRRNLSWWLRSGRVLGGAHIGMKHPFQEGPLCEVGQKEACSSQRRFRPCLLHRGWLGCVLGGAHAINLVAKKNFSSSLRKTTSELLSRHATFGNMSPTFQLGVNGSKGVLPMWMTRDLNSLFDQSSYIYTSIWINSVQPRACCASIPYRNKGFMRSLGI